MYKNTVPGECPEAGSIAVVVSGGIGAFEAVTLAMQSGNDGQRLLVFPGADLLSRSPYSTPDGTPQAKNLVSIVSVNIVTMSLMTKDDAIKTLGGTPRKAAKVLGYTSVQAVYVWPDVLTLALADRVRGASLRLKETRKRKVSSPEKEVA